MTMDMLQLSKLLLLFSLFLLMLSCNKKGEEERKQKTENSNEINETYKKFTIQNIGLEEYNNIYNAARDSVKNWVNYGLISSKMQKNASEWALDSTFCVNKQKDKSIFAILNRKSNTISNSINYLYGVRINERWYFFHGSTLYVDSGMNEKVAKSFEELHQRALEQFFIGYLKKSPTGEWEINDKFFNRMINKNNPAAAGYKGGYGSCFRCETFEEYVLYLVNENWKNLDTTQYSRTR